MKQPNWKRWEAVLLVDIYFRQEGHLEKTVEECEKLTRLLRRSNQGSVVEIFMDMSVWAGIRKTIESVNANALVL